MWLERLDARASRWPTIIRWPYLSLKWFLIIMGVYLAAGLAWDGNALGLGIFISSILAAIKGVTLAFHNASNPRPPA